MTKTIKSITVAVLLAGSLSLSSFGAAADEHRGGKQHKNERDYVSSYHDKHERRSAEGKKWRKEYRRYPNRYYADEGFYGKRHDKGHRYGHHKAKHEEHYLKGYRSKRIHHHDHRPVIERVTVVTPHRHYSPRLSLGVHLGHFDLHFVD